MRKALLALFIFAGLGAAAQEYKGHYGVGLALGEPSGFSVKKFNNRAEAFQYTLGYNLISGQERVNFGVDYLLHTYDFITAEKGSIPFYYGGGVHLAVGNNANNMLYARVPLGVAYEMNDLPLDVFFEFAPGIAVLPAPNLVTNFAIGARYYFDVKAAVKKIDDAI